MQEQEPVEMCAICMEDITHDYVITKCGHKFHYLCIRECDMAHRLEIYDMTELEELFSNYSIYKDMINDEDDIDPLMCPLCRSPVKYLRETQILNKNKSTLPSQIIKCKKSKKNKHSSYMFVYDEPQIIYKTYKYKSNKRYVNNKLQNRRFNK